MTTVCLLAARVEYVWQRVGKVMGLLEHVGTNEADKVGTMTLLESYRQLVSELKDRRLGGWCCRQVVGGRRADRNSRIIEINSPLQRTCEMEEVGFVDVWCKVVAYGYMICTSEQ